MRSRQFEITQRDQDEAALKKITQKWDSVGCYYCGSLDRMCEDADGNKWKCPVCNKEE